MLAEKCAADTASAPANRQPSMPSEYYIRQPDSDEARGPFSVDQMLSLVEAEQMDPETLYYDEEAEEWVNVGSNDELRKALFAEKRRLSLKPKGKEDIESLNAADDDEDAGVSVGEMLAAAEGDTEETRHLKKASALKEKAAALAIPAIGMIMFISALINLIPNYQYVVQIIEGFQGAEVDVGPILTIIEHPDMILGLADLMLAVFLFLSVTEIYPLLRIRAMAGLAYFGYVYYAMWQNAIEFDTGGGERAMFMMIAAIAGHLGVYICTLTLNFYIMALSALVGLGGMATLAYYLTIGSL